MVKILAKISLLCFCGFAFFLVQSLSSSIELVRTKVQFTAYHPLSKVKGICSDIYIDNVNIQKGSTLRLTNPMVAICDVKQMNTKNKKRNRHMRKAIGYPEYKKVILELHKLRKKTSPKGKQTPQEYTLSGIISISGEKRPFSSIASVSQVANQITFDGEFFVVLSDFGIPRPSFLGLKINDTVDLKYRIVLSVTTATSPKNTH